MPSADRLQYTVIHGLRIYRYSADAAVFKRPQLIFRYGIGSSCLGGKFTDICNIKFTEFINKAVKLSCRQRCRRAAADIYRINFKREPFYYIRIDIKFSQKKFKIIVCQFKRTLTRCRYKRTITATWRAERNRNIQAYLLKTQRIKYRLLQTDYIVCKL